MNVLEKKLFAPNCDMPGNVVLPEYMIQHGGSKVQRLVGSMILKYSILLHYLPKHSSILDMCCGTGFGASLLAASGHNVLGVDIYRKSIDCASQRANIKTLKADALTIKLDQKFDAVISVDAIEHFTQEDQPKLIANCYRHVAPGGYLLIDTPLSGVSKVVSKQHLWELSWDDFLTVFTSGGEFRELHRYYIDNIWINGFDLSFPFKVDQKPNNTSENTDQLILGRKL